MSFNSILSEAAHLLLDSQYRIKAIDVVNKVAQDDPDLFAAETHRLAVESASRIVKQILRELSEDDHSPDSQLALPDLLLPSAIAIEDEMGGFSYIKTAKATLADLEQGLGHRDMNIIRATKKRDQYEESLELLRPYMQDGTTTVEEALRRMTKDAA